MNQPERKLKVALMVVGLTRTYQETVQSLFSEVVEKYRDLVDFDIFLTTWNIRGTVKAEKSFYNMVKSEQNWVKENEVIELAELSNNLIQAYQPKQLTIVDYEEKFGQNGSEIEKMQEFILRFDLNSQKEMIKHSIFSQYYLVARAYQELEEYIREEGVTYDLVIKTRFDLKYLESQINWLEMKLAGQTYLITMKQWEPDGVDDQIIIGNLENLGKYSQLYYDLVKMTEKDLSKIKMISFHLPAFYVHYRVPYEKEMDFEQLYQQQIDQIKGNLMEFLEIKREFITSVVPERLLLYYLGKYWKLQFYAQEFFKTELIRDIY